MQHSSSALRPRRFEVIRDPTGGQKEQRDQCAALGFGKVLTTRRWRCPPGAAPSIIRSEEPSRFVERHDQIDLAVWMGVLITAKHGLDVVRALHAVHVDGCDAEVECFGARLAELAAPITWAVDLNVCGPALLYARRNETCEFIVQLAPGPIGAVEPLLKFRSGRPVLDLLEKGNAAGDQCFALTHDGDLQSRMFRITVTPL